MAVRSLPQSGHNVGDSGPYTDAEWAEYMSTVYTGDDEATQGPLVNYANELLPSNPSGLTIRVATGAGVCYGHFMINDSNCDITVDAAGANPDRTDRIVMCQNATNAGYDGAGDYGVACVKPMVPRNSCRPAVLQGVTATGAARVLATGANAYMVELGRYIISGSTIGAITDYRDFCEFRTMVGDGTVGTDAIVNSAVTAAKIANRTRYIFVPATGGYGANTGSLPPYDGSESFGIKTIETENSTIVGTTVTPTDYSSGMISRAVVVPSPSGDVWSYNSAYYGACGEMDNTHGVSSGYIATSITNGYNNCIQEISLIGVAAGDIISCIWHRVGTNPSDTCTNVYITGWLISYTADS